MEIGQDGSPRKLISPQPADKVEMENPRCRGRFLSFSARYVLITTLFAALALPGASFEEDFQGGQPQEIIDRYVSQSQAQQQSLRGVQMDIDISADLPKMKRHGKLHALRSISRVGRITYDAIRFEGDNTVKKEVIARYLSAETEATKETSPPITPQYYKFRYRGLVNREGQPVHLFSVSPRKKLAGTFKGELWLDKDTCLPLREAGRLVKNPSVFVRSFDFVRTYEIKDGIAIPKQTTGTVSTRLWGTAEMMIDFSNFTRLQPEAAANLERESAASQN